MRDMNDDEELNKHRISLFFLVEVVCLTRVSPVEKKTLQ